MGGEARMWKVVSLMLVGLLIVTAMAGLLFYSRLSAVEERYRSTVESLDGLSFSVDLLINYGNGTKIWHNGSRIPIGFSLFNATVRITDGGVDATYYPQFQAYFINSIDGVGGEPERPGWAWISWRYDGAEGRWTTYEVGADQVFPQDGDVIAWYYEDTSGYPSLEPPD